MSQTDDTSTGNSTDKRKLLLVDDEVGSIKVMNKVLEADYSVSFATSGGRALELLQDSLPDLILLDMLMPGMDGTEVLQLIRANPHTQSIPVVFVTAKDDADSESHALALGADDFIHKPINPDVLRARVASHLERSHLRALTEQHRDQLAEKTVALQEAVQELDAFAYSVSHDLRAPLRAIHGFASLLSMQHTDGLNADALDFLRRIQDASSNMEQLINDILELSRVSRVDLQRQTVNLSELALQAIDQLSQAFPEHCVEVQVEPGIEASCDPQLIRVALNNLLGNAWKFTAQTAAARIEFASEIRAGQRYFVVRDNGAGFDMTHAAKLFLPFQRLHSQREFAGSGIGLATVARAIRKHGGKLWGEGEVGQGASFYFSLSS